MLKRVISEIVRITVPRFYWKRRFSKLRRGDLREEEEMSLAPLLCDKTKTSVDIGAAGGVYTACVVDKSYDCLAFEPRPAEALILKQMFGYLSLPVRVQAVALSDIKGEATLRILDREPGRSTIEPENVLEDRDGSRKSEIKVPTRLLDDYDLASVGFIKIDVEGHELAVLNGGIKTIQRCLPMILIEIEDRHKPNNLKEVDAFLRSIGYEGYFILDRQLNSLDIFDPTIHQDPANVGGWKGGWKKSGIYVNNFIFAPSGSKSRLKAAFETHRGAWDSRVCAHHLEFARIIMPDVRKLWGIRLD